MRLFVNGSLAYDRIMTFPGRFQDHILPDKLHILNVCFLVEGLDEKFGGTAGNIAYSLRLLDEDPLIIGSAGKDFDAYSHWLRAQGLSLRGIRIVETEFTAGAYITTDKADNQITGFNPGAMRHPSSFDWNTVPPVDALAIISPGNVQDMTEYPRILRQLKIPYIFDPGQQTTALSPEQLIEAITGAAILTVNDYELELIMNVTGKTREELQQLTGAVIVTLGEKGSLILKKGREIPVPAAKAAKVADPTGAGDAFRAGLLHGLAKGMELPDAALVGATCASFCVERHGTQEHAFSAEEFAARHKENFGV